MDESPPHPKILSLRKMWAGLGILESPLLDACTLEFFRVDKRVCSLHLQVKEQVLTVICSYASDDSSEYPSFLESMCVVLEIAPPVDSVVLLRDFNAHVGNAI